MNRNTEITQEAIVTAYYDAIVAHCNRKLNYDIDAARDIAQDAFCELFAHWAHFDSRTEAGLVRWLYRTADILIKKHFRLKKRALRLCAPLDPELCDEEFQIDAPILFREEQEQYLNDLKEIKSGLSEKETAIFEYIMEKGLSVPQAAGLLGMKENTVMVSLYRLRKKLKKRLEKRKRP